MFLTEPNICIGSACAGHLPQMIILHQIFMIRDSKITDRSSNTTLRLHIVILMPFMLWGDILNTCKTSCLLPIILHKEEGPTANQWGRGQLSGSPDPVQIQWSDTHVPELVVLPNPVVYPTESLQEWNYQNLLWSSWNSHQLKWERLK